MIGNPILAVAEDYDFLFGLVFVILSCISVYGFHYARKARDRHTLMSTTKTSLVRDLKRGPAEVSGRAAGKAGGLRSPWSNRECVYYWFHVEQYSSGEHGGSWDTYISDTAPPSFLVADETGEIEILASEGEIDLRVDRHSESGSGNAAPDQLKNLLTSKYGKSTKGILGIGNRNLRYTESYLEAGDKVYVFGQASQASDGRWVMRHGEMPLIVSESGERDVETKTLKKSTLSGAIGAAILAVATIVVWVIFR
jgi:hypothetical protein